MSQLHTWFRRRGEQLRLLVRRVPQLIAALTDLGILGEDSVHRPFRAEVAVFVEQARVDLRRCLVGEARLVQDIEHGAPLA
jgi:hypothetical protein